MSFPCTGPVGVGVTLAAGEGEAAGEAEAAGAGEAVAEGEAAGEAEGEGLAAGDGLDAGDGLAEGDGLGVGEGEAAGLALGEGEAAGEAETPRLKLVTLAVISTDPALRILPLVGAVMVILGLLSRFTIVFCTTGGLSGVLSLLTICTEKEWMPACTFFHVKVGALVIL